MSLYHLSAQRILVVVLLLLVGSLDAPPQLTRGLAAAQEHADGDAPLLCSLKCDKSWEGDSTVMQSADGRQTNLWSCGDCGIITTVLVTTGDDVDGIAAVCSNGEPPKQGDKGFGVIGNLKDGANVIAGPFRAAYIMKYSHYRNPANPAAGHVSRIKLQPVTKYGQAEGQNVTYGGAGRDDCTPEDGSEDSIDTPNCLYAANYVECPPGEYIASVGASYDALNADWRLESLDFGCRKVTPAAEPAPPPVVCPEIPKQPAPKTEWIGWTVGAIIAVVGWIGAILAYFYGARMKAAVANNGMWASIMQCVCPCTPQCTHSEQASFDQSGSQSGNMGGSGSRVGQALTGI